MVKYVYVVRTILNDFVLTVNSYPTRSEAEKAADDIKYSKSPFTADVIEVIR